MGAERKHYNPWKQMPYEIYDWEYWFPDIQKVQPYGNVYTAELRNGYCGGGHFDEFTGLFIPCTRSGCVVVHIHIFDFEGLYTNATDLMQKPEVMCGPCFLDFIAENRDLIKLRYQPHRLEKFVHTTPKAVTGKTSHTYGGVRQRNRYYTSKVKEEQYEGRTNTGTHHKIS
jgi:hypothetical protein